MKISKRGKWLRSGKLTRGEFAFWILFVPSIYSTMSDEEEDDFGVENHFGEELEEIEEEEDTKVQCICQQRFYFILNGTNGLFNLLVFFINLFYWLCLLSVHWDSYDATDLIRCSKTGEKGHDADDDKVTLTAHRYKSFLFTGI